MDKIEKLKAAMRLSGFTEDEIANAVKGVMATEADDEDASIVEAEPVDVENDHGFIDAEPIAANGASAAQATSANLKSEDVPERKPCPVCGEMIANAARKCRFCGTILDELLKKELPPSEEEENRLGGADIIFGLLCAPIAFLVAFECMVKGKTSKAGKMAIIGVGGAFLWIMFSALTRSV